MQLGISFEKILLIGLIAVLIVGPDKLPKYAESFAKLVRRAGEMLRDTKSRVREEMGPEIDDVDWRKLDPRQYDPRRIIRDALFEDAAPAAAATAAARTAASAAEQAPARPRIVREEFSRSSPPPFDVEAT
ncbi:twin-arginine translocase TatA/TatE family subunit [Microbacterium sp. ZW T5_45]|uniref:twin-arginine translocase TatA/TatE family subunit n=1 Tax=Microbacterium sp. ZW T5_45 TaxID=3378080 RepID=UPI0038538950